MNNFEVLNTEDLNNINGGFRERMIDDDILV